MLVSQPLSLCTNTHASTNKKIIARLPMKFKLLSIGQKFEYEDIVYVKTSPLVASNIKTGHNKMIPRYASLTLLDDSGSQLQQPVNVTVETEAVITAFNHFYEKCIDVLEQNDLLIPEIKNDFDAARDEFVTVLNKKPA